MKNKISGSPDVADQIETAKQDAEYKSSVQFGTHRYLSAYVIL